MDDRLDGKKILVIDDSPDILFLTKIILSKAGAEVEVAPSLELIPSEFVAPLIHRFLEFDLILMDLQISREKKSGYDILRYLRNIGYTNPIVAFIGHAQPEVKEKCLKSGFNDYISKPVSFKDLLKVLKKHLH